MLTLATLAVGLVVVPTATQVLAPQAAFAQGDQDQSPVAEADASAVAATPSAEAPPSATSSATATPSEPIAPTTVASNPAPTIASDLSDYPPGGTVTLTGAGWQAGEVVTIAVNDTGGLSWSLTEKVVADPEGRITLIFNLPDHYVPDYDVTATGAESGVARTTFTDAATGGWQYWMAAPLPVEATPVSPGGLITYTLNARKNGTGNATVTGAVMTLTLSGNATFTSSGNIDAGDGGVAGIGTNTVTWSAMSLSGTGGTNLTRTITVTATVATSAPAGTLTATTADSNDPNGAPYTGAGRFILTTHNVTGPTVGKCSFAPAGSGDFSRSICWFDLTGYDATIAASTNGQAMQQTLLNGYVLSYTVKATGTSTNVAADGLPTYSAAFLGNNGAGYTNNYQGIPGKPALYQHSAGTTVLTLTGISLKKSGVAVTGFALVGADAESTDSGESITWTSDKVLTSIGALGNACGGTLVMSSGNTVATCNAGPVANKTGAAILYTLDPGTFTQTMVGSGLQAVAFGVMVSGLQLNKQIVHQLPGDQFRIAVTRSDGTLVATAITDLVTGSAATEQVYTISTGAAQVFTLSEAPVGSASSTNYATTWACTKNGAPFTPTDVSPGIKTAAVTMNDFVQCTITNTGPTLTLRKSVDTTAGGALTPASWTLAATKSGTAPAITEAPSLSSSTVGKVTTASTTTVAVPAGSYTLGESSTATGAAWYAASAWACTIAGGGNAPLSGNSVSVAAGNDVTCTITNTAIPPTIILRKSTVGAAAGPFSFALTNTVQAVGTVTTTAADTRTQVDGDTVTAGVQPFTASTPGAAVTIDEPRGPMPAGWVLGSATCSNGATTVGSLTGTTYTILASELVRGAVITCDFSNRPTAGTATWSKVDAGSTSTLLRGSEWTLTGPSYPTAVTIVDCTSSPCVGPDTDPVAGQFSVPVLSGTYTLVEKTAPIGFQRDATVRTVILTTDGQVVGLGAISNKRWVVPALPLTGGASTDAFLLIGAALIAAAGMGARLHRRRLLGL